MWDIVGKPSGPLSMGKDTEGSIIERLGGVAFNIASGLSKALDKRCFEIILVSVIGKNERSNTIIATLDENQISTKYMIIKGKENDQYLSIETENGEIYGSINSSNSFLAQQIRLKHTIDKISTEHRKLDTDAILIFDGNCPRDFLDYVKEKTRESIFTKYFVPANFSKLSEFQGEAMYFSGFNLILNIEEAKVLMGTKYFKSSVDASKAIFKEIISSKCLAIVTNGPNILCGVNNKELVKLKPSKIHGNVSKLGAGDYFFSNFLSFQETNPGALLEEVLHYAKEKTYKYLKNNV